MKVEEVMSNPVITVDLDAPLSRVIERMVTGGIGSVVVEDRDQEIYTIVTESDVVRQLHAHSGEHALVWLWSQPIHTMVKDTLHTIPPTTLISEAVRTMAELNIRRLPVVDIDDELLGIVTERDLLRAMGGMKWKRGT